MSVDLLNQYIDYALTFERLAKTEPNSGLKADLERQANAYRRLAAKHASKLGLPPPSKPDRKAVAAMTQGQAGSLQERHAQRSAT